MTSKTISTPLTADQKDPYRYSKELNTSYIDIALDVYRELYNEWDFSPAANRDLDEELLLYLEDCVAEIPWKHNICVVFHIPAKAKNKDKEEKSVQGLTNYFNYEIRKENNKRKLKVHTGIRYGFWGGIILLLATLISSYLEQNTEYQIFSFINEGFFVGGWVLIWELCSIAFFGTEEHKNNLKTLTRLRDAKIEFSYK